MVAHDTLLSSMKMHKDWQYEKGLLPPLKLDKYNQALFDTFHWIEDTNEIFKNIELILDDLALYSTLHNPSFYFMPGDKTTRYFLLIRTFFYEFYRIKEICNLFLAKMKKIKVFSKAEVEEARTEFHKAFEHAFTLRNQMVHRRFIWGGQKHCCLVTVRACESFGYCMENMDTGELVQADNLLAELVAEWSEQLFAETKSMVEVIDALACHVTDTIVTTLTKDPTRE